MSDLDHRYPAIRQRVGVLYIYIFIGVKIHSSTIGLLKTMLREGSGICIAKPLDNIFKMYCLLILFVPFLCL